MKPKSIFESRLYRFGGLQPLNEEEFRYYDLPPDERAKMFDNFKDSYERSVGSSHDQRWFESRARGWTFWGSIDGGIAARMQHPWVNGPGGMPERKSIWRLTASYGTKGSMLGTLRGGKEFLEKHGHEPAWAVLTPNLAQYVVKVSKGDFSIAPKSMVRELYPALTDGGHGRMAHQIQCDPDGTLWARTPTGKPIEKVVVVNNAYIDMFPDYKDFIKASLQSGGPKKAPEVAVAKAITNEAFDPDAEQAADFARFAEEPGEERECGICGTLFMFNPYREDGGTEDPRYGSLCPECALAVMDKELSKEYGE